MDIVLTIWSQDRVVVIVSRVGWMTQGSIPCRPRDFCLCQMSKPAVFPTEPLTKLMGGGLYHGVNHTGHGAEHSPSLMSRLAMSGAVPLLPLCVHVME